MFRIKKVKRNDRHDVKRVRGSHIIGQQNTFDTIVTHYGWLSCRFLEWQYTVA